MYETKYLTQIEVATRLKVGTRMVRNLRLAGVLNFLPGRPARIAEEDVVRFIEQLKSEVREMRPSGILADVTNRTLWPEEGQDAEDPKQQIEEGFHSVTPINGAPGIVMLHIRAPMPRALARHIINQLPNGTSLSNDNGAAAGE